MPMRLLLRSAHNGRVEHIADKRRLRLVSPLAHQVLLPLESRAESASPGTVGARENGVATSFSDLFPREYCNTR
jgi:hypothetical protein